MRPEKKYEIVKVFYDLETTGVNPRKNSIHQIAGIIECDGEITERFNIFSRPHPRAIIETAAPEVCNLTEEQILSYPEMEVSFEAFRALIRKYVNQWDKTSNAHLIGFNNRGFDDLFLRKWFEQNGDEFINSLFWADTIDVLCLASQYLLNRRHAMPSFKLRRVATELGLEIDKNRLHDANYDVEITRQIYRIVTGLEVEI